MERRFLLLFSLELHLECLTFSVYACIKITLRIQCNFHQNFSAILHEKLNKLSQNLYGNTKDLQEPEQYGVIKSTSHYSWFQTILQSYSNKKRGASIKIDIQINGNELRTQIKAHAPTFVTTRPQIPIGEKMMPSINDASETGLLHVEWNQILISYHTKNSKCIKHLNVSSDTQNPLDDEGGNVLQFIGTAKDLLHRILEA